MPIQFLKDLSNIKKYYTISDAIDPKITAVILLKESLSEAVINYSQKNAPKHDLPTFIILDLEAGLIQDSELTKLIKKYKLNIIPMARALQIPQKEFCFYTKIIKPSEIMINKVLAMLSICEQIFGIRNNISIDKAVFDQPYPPSTRHDFVNSRMEDIVKIYNALCDDLSREQFLRIIKFLQTGDTCYLAPAPYAQYEHPIVKAEKGDFIIEGGLDAGDTTVNFLEQVGAGGHVYGFEPLLQSYELTRRKTKKYANATIEHYGLFSKSTKFYVENYGCSSFLVETPTANSEECRAIRIDDYAKRNISKCDIIKLDIEGAEIECLMGAENTIKKYFPKLQISIYHLPPNHYLDIPLMILEKYPEYQLYIGHHGFWVWETMLYAIKK